MKKSALASLLLSSLIALESNAFIMVCKMKVGQLNVERHTFMKIGNSDISAGGLFGTSVNVGDITYNFGVSDFLNIKDKDGKEVELKEGEAVLSVTKVERLLTNAECEANDFSSCFKKQVLDFKIIKLSGKYKTDLTFAIDDGQSASISCSTGSIQTHFPLN